MTMTDLGTSGPTAISLGTLATAVAMLSILPNYLYKMVFLGLPTEEVLLF